MPKKPKKTYVDKSGKRKPSMYANLKEGAFTSWCKSRGFSDVQKCASHVLANPGKFSLKTVKRAQFAKNQK